MDLVNVTIDDQQVSVPKGTLIVEAAKQVGVDIPIFCYHPKMKPVGACRMCFVEIEKMPRPQTACTTPVGEGMVVRTKTPTVKEAQESVLEFLLINHPLDCPICDKGGECPLQDNTFAYGPGASRYTEVKRRYEKPIAISEYIKLDRERCIMCYRCTRFASEIAGDEALTVLDRGSHSEIGLAPGRTFDSPFSGNTIELCPVGALTSDLYRFRARPWDIKNHPTVCTECPVGCNVTLTVRNNSIMRNLARENTPVDDGWLCDHGRFTYQYVSSEERLKQPMIRRDGKLEAVDWEEAIAYAGSKLREVIQHHGPNSAAGLISERQSNEDMYLFQKLFRAVIGNNNVDSSLDRHAPPAGGAYDAAWTSIADLEKAGVIVLLNVDPIKGQPIIDLRLKKAAALGSKLIVISRDKIDLVRHAALWLQPREGSEAALIGGVLSQIIEDRSENAEFIDQHTRRLDLVRDELTSITLETAAENGGLGIEDMRTAVDLIAQAESTTFVYPRELWADADSDALLSRLACLALVTGNAGKPGAGLFPLPARANAQGTIDMGVRPHLLPGQRSISDDSVREKLTALWGTKVPGDAGVAGAELCAAAEAGEIRALVVVNGEMRNGIAGAAGLGDSRELSKIRQHLDLLIVQDMFLSDAASQADVVLPGYAFAEMDGTLTNLERRIQRLRPATIGPGQSRPAWQFIRDLANELGGAFDVAAPADVMAEISLAAPIYAGITYAVVGDKGIQWPRRQSDGKGSDLIHGPESGHVWDFAEISNGTAAAKSGERSQ